MALLQQFGTEIAAAVLASLAIVLGTVVWKRGLQPTLERWVYRDLRLEGTWDVTGVEDGRPFKERAEVQQNGHKVWGVLHYEGKNSRGQEERLDYVFEGEFANTILTARHWSRNRSGLDRGGFTLKAESDDNLVGYYAWHLNDLDQEGRVIADKYVWVRRSNS
jgi:hypothetical protein